MRTRPERIHAWAPTLLAAVALLVWFTVSPAAGSGSQGQPHVSADTELDAGRYLVLIGGCNDCHTGNWAESGGTVPESDWLTGVPIGFKGPWGTTYPSNLRLLVQEIDEQGWTAMLRTRTALPPMPWVNLNRLSDSDSRAIYRYIRSLGNQGVRMPLAVAPGVEPSTPYFVFEPVHMERMPHPPQAGSGPH